MWVLTKLFKRHFLPLKVRKRYSSKCCKHLHFWYYSSLRTLHTVSSSTSALANRLKYIKLKASKAWTERGTALNYCPYTWVIKLGWDVFPSKYVSASHQRCFPKEKNPLTNNSLSLCPSTPSMGKYLNIFSSGKFLQNSTFQAALIWSIFYLLFCLLLQLFHLA